MEIGDVHGEHRGGIVGLNGPELGAIDYVDVNVAGH